MGVAAFVVGAAPVSGAGTLVVVGVGAEVSGCVAGDCSAVVAPPAPVAEPELVDAVPADELSVGVPVPVAAVLPPADSGAVPVPAPDDDPSASPPPEPDDGVVTSGVESDVAVPGAVESPPAPSEDDVPALEDDVPDVVASAGAASATPWLNAHEATMTAALPAAFATTSHGRDTLMLTPHRYREMTREH